MRVGLDNISSVQQKLDLSKNQIRMVELQASQNLEDRVVCRLINVTLTDKLEFVALSSLLGDAPITTEYITVNDRPIRIPTTIEQALRHLRAVFLPSISMNGTVSPSETSLHHSIHSNDSRDMERMARYQQQYQQKQQQYYQEQQQQQQLPPARKPPGWLVQVLRNVRSILPDSSKSRSGSREQRQPPNTLYVWIDAMCVNRNNMVESSSLLSHMGTVYRQAKMVIGWLGLKGPDTDAGIEGAVLFEQAFPPTFGEPGDERINPENYAPHHEWMKQLEHVWNGGEESRYYPGLFDLVTRPYFNRNWILDELALARYPAFLIGDRIVSWNQILVINRINEEIRDHESNVFPAELRPLVHEWPLGTIYSLLREFEKRQRLEKMQPGYTKTPSLSTTSSNISR